MTNSDDRYNKKFNELTSDERQKLINTYRKLGEFYTKVAHKTANSIFNWGFTLNTGGLAATIAFMNGSLSKTALSFTPLIFIFTLGIIAIVLALFLENSRFKEKGTVLEKKFKELDEGKITCNEFLSSVFPTTSDCCEKMVLNAEKTSYALFFLGLLIAILIFFV